MTVTEQPEIVDRATGEIVRYVGTGPMLPSRQSPAELAQQAREVRELQQAVLTEGTDYGIIPGTQRPSLYKSGAEWLLKWAGYGHRLEPVEVERDDQGRKFGLTYRCTVHLLGDSSAVVSTCDGYAGYDEDRFYQSQASLEARERANAEKYQRRVNALKFAEEYRAPWNSVLKMAEKRALVGATLQATATSGLFTQDMEDHGPGVREDAPFIELGWTSKAEHDDARESLVGFVRNDLDDDAKAALKEWMASEGFGLGQPNSPATLATIKARAEALLGHDDPFHPQTGPATSASTLEDGGSAITPADGEPNAPGGATAASERQDERVPDDPMQGIVDLVAAMDDASVDAGLLALDVEPEGNRDKRRLVLTGLLYQDATGSDMAMSTHPAETATTDNPQSVGEAGTAQPQREGAAELEKGVQGPPVAEHGDAAAAQRTLESIQQQVVHMASAEVVAELVKRNLSSAGSSAVRAQRLVDAMLTEASS